MLSFPTMHLTRVFDNFFEIPKFTGVLARMDFMDRETNIDTEWTNTFKWFRGSIGPSKPYINQVRLRCEGGGDETSKPE